MADGLSGIRCLTALDLSGQRIDKIAGEIGAIGRRQRRALFAREVILQNQFVIVFGNNEIGAGALEISVEQQVRIRNDDGARRYRGGVL